MEIQVVAEIKACHVDEIRSRINSASLRNNFKFIPKYHLEDLLESSTDDLMQFTTQVLKSDWGPWSPRGVDRMFIQTERLYITDVMHLRIALIRDHKERKRIYIVSNDARYYNKRLDDAHISCYMSDLDDDGNFTADDIDNDIIETMNKVD